MADLLMPFRKKDTDEAMRLIRPMAVVSALSMAFYKNLDLGNDGVWDVWQLGRAEDGCGTSAATRTSTFG